MAHVDSHTPGSFCWLELATTDQDAAKHFYTSLFGWSIVDHSMGPTGTYTMFQLEGRDVGAAYSLSPEMRQQGVPPNWMVYVATANADETAAKAEAAGGKLVTKPLDVMDLGRMAIIQDPTGAHFAVWQAKGSPGTTIEGVPGTLCWADLVTSQPDRAAKFYSEAIGWEVDPGQDGSGYLHVKNGSNHIGGIPPVQPRNAQIPPHWMSYFLVNDCDKSAAQAKQLGATLHMGPTTMERVGRMAIVGDPQGASFALFQPLPHS